MHFSMFYKDGACIRTVQVKDNSKIKRFDKKKRGFWTRFFVTDTFTFAFITVITPIKKSSVERDKNLTVFFAENVMLYKDGACIRTL